MELQQAMTHCQKCGIPEETGDGLRILPYWADFPDSQFNWLALCRPCLEGETVERRRREHNRRLGGHPRLAAPLWEQATRLTDWHREALEGKR